MPGSTPGRLAWFRRSVDDNGIKAAPGDHAVRWHDARHSAATRLIRLGASLPAVKEILGHANLTTTALYVHAQRKDVVDAHALLDKATRKGPHRAPAQSMRAKAAGSR
jgi:site-specific recombinase XerD